MAERVVSISLEVVLTVTAQPVDYTDPQALKQWRESLMAFELRSICAAEAAGFTESTRFGAVRDRLRAEIDGKTLAAASAHFPDLHDAIFGERKGDRMMLLVKHYAEVANTLANNLLVRSKPGDMFYEVELRLALLYSTGILLEDVLVEIQALDELPLDLVNGARHYLIACSFKPQDFQTLKPLLICETDSQFMQALNALVADFRAKRNMWELVKVAQARSSVIPTPPALAA